MQRSRPTRWRVRAASRRSGANTAPEPAAQLPLDVGGYGACGCRPERFKRPLSQSITALAGDQPISRQAITKHLEVLEAAGLTGSRREGRERIFELRPERLTTVHRYLDRIGRRWDEALARLRVHVEQEEGRET